MRISPVVIFIILLLIGFFLFEYLLYKKYLILNGLPAQYRNYYIISEQESEMNFFISKDEVKMMKFKIMVINNNIDRPTVQGLSKMIFLREDGYLIELPGSGEGLNWWKMGDFDGKNSNGLQDLYVAVLYENMGSGSFDPFYLYKWNGENFEILLKNDDLFNEDELVDLNNDGVMEIKHTYRLDKFAFPWEDIYAWDKWKEEYILVNHLFPLNYTQWLETNNHDIWDYSGPNGAYLKEINACLVNRAKMFANSVYGNIDECKQLL